MILSKMTTMAMATGTSLEVGPGRLFFLGCFGNPRFGSAPAARLRPGKDSGFLFLHVQIILYRFYPFGATGDFNRFSNGLLRIDEVAHLDDALVGFHTDLK
jgi:hypothetical protein